MCVTISFALGDFRPVAGKVASHHSLRLSPSGDRSDTTTALSAELSAALAGRYILERELGGGGMSRVFLAREIALGRIVVLKVWEKVTGPR
jgi:serine/threonine protein kinase